MNRWLAATRKDRGIACGVFKGRHFQSVVAAEHILAAGLHVDRPDLPKAENVHANGLRSHPWDQSSDVTQLGVRWQFLGADTGRWAPNSRFAPFSTWDRDGRGRERRMLTIQEEPRLLPEGITQGCDVAKRPRNVPGEQVQATALVQIRTLCQSCGPVEKTCRKPQLAQQPIQTRCGLTAVYMIRCQVLFPRQECAKVTNITIFYVSCSNQKLPNDTFAEMRKSFDFKCEAVLPQAG